MEGGQQQIDDVEKKMPDAVGERERGSVSSYDDTFSEKSTVARGTPFPSSIYRILFSELCERFAYYGLVGILALFFKNELGQSEDQANAYMQYFNSAAYFSPLIGSFISDSYWGKYAVIIRFSLIYSAGAAVLTGAGVNNTFWLTFVGLGLIALGTGGIKPCVSSFGADQLRDMPDRTERMTAYFSFFYFSINLGSIVAFVVIPEISSRLGYEFAFGACSLVLFQSVFVIWSGRSMYLHAPLEGSVFTVVYNVMADARRAKRNGGFLAIADGDVAPPEYEPEATEADTTPALAPKKLGSVSDVANELDDADGERPKHWLDWAVPYHGRQRVEDIKSVLRVLPVFAFLPIFWCLFNQQQSTWLFQAERMDRHIFGYEIEPSQFQIINPLCIMILLPLFAKGVWPALARCGIAIKLLDRMCIGFVIASASFFVSAWVQSFMEDRMVGDEPAGETHIALQIPQIAIISVSEILISVTGLEFAYSQAPETMKSIITALYLITNAVGSLLAGAVFSAVDGRLSRVVILVIFATMMIAVLFPFLIVRYLYIYVPGTDGTEILKAYGTAPDDDDLSGSEDSLEKPVGTMAVGTSESASAPLLSNEAVNDDMTRPSSSGSINHTG